MVTLILLAVIALAPDQQPPPPPLPPPSVQPPRDTVRDRERTGTAVIRGRVVAADTGLPIRQANVMLSEMMPTSPSAASGAVVAGTVEMTGGTVMSTRGRPGDQRGTPSMPMRPRSTRTDDQGAFEFKALPAGSYRVNAATGQFAAQYLPLSFGARRPMMDPGTPIDLADGQTFDKATIALPRGGVIVGRVTDDGGEPMARVQVYSLLYPSGTNRGQRTGGGFNQTDDLGQFRLFGLQPGEYAIVAEARMNTFMPPNMAQPDGDEDRSGFLTTYFPATADEGAAQRVRVRSGSETPGVEIRMSRGRLYRMSGLVMDSQGRPLPRVNGMVGRRTGGTAMFNTGFSTDEQGRFQMQNLQPGTYRIVIRQRQQNFGPNGPEGDPGEMASVPVTLAGADVENLTIVTAPGVTLSGQVEFEQGPPDRPLKGVRVSAVPGDPEASMMFGPPPNATVEADMTFKLLGLSGELLIRGGGGLPPTHYIKAVLLNGSDISDVPREFKTGDRITLLVSSRPATIEGTVTDAKGTPTTDAGIIIFPDDKSAWRSNSTRVRRGGPDSQGRYRLTPLHPGRYFILAAPRERLTTFPGTDYPVFYEELSKEATTLVVNEDETRTVDLKVVTGSGGQ